MSQTQDKNTDQQQGEKAANNSSQSQNSFSIFGGNASKPLFGNVSQSFGGAGSIFNQGNSDGQTKPPIFGNAVKSSSLFSGGGLFGQKSQGSAFGGLGLFGQPKDNQSGQNNGNPPQGPSIFGGSITFPQSSQPLSSQAPKVAEKTQKKEDTSPFGVQKNPDQESVPLDFVKKINKQEKKEEAPKQIQKSENTQKKPQASQPFGNKPLFSFGSNSPFGLGNANPPKQGQAPKSFGAGFSTSPQNSVFNFGNISQPSSKPPLPQKKSSQLEKKDVNPKLPAEKKLEPIFSQAPKDNEKKGDKSQLILPVNTNQTLQIPILPQTKNEPLNPFLDQKKEQPKLFSNQSIFGRDKDKNLDKELEIPTPKKTQSIDEPEGLGKKRSPKRKTSDPKIQVPQAPVFELNKGGTIFGDSGLGTGKLFSKPQQTQKKSPEIAGEVKQKPPQQNMFSANNSFTSNISQPPSTNKQEKAPVPAEFFNLEDLEDIINFGQKSDIDKNQNKIAQTLMVFLKVAQKADTEFFKNPDNYLKSKNINNEGYQKLLNDFILFARSVLHFGQDSFIPLKNTLREMLSTYKLQDKLLQNNQLTEIAKFNFYTGNGSALTFQEDNERSVQLLMEFIRYQFSGIIKCLRALASRRRDPAIELLFHKTKIFDNLFQSCLLISLRKPITQNKNIYAVCKQSDELVLDQLLFILSYFNKPSKNSKLTSISLDYFIPLIDEVFLAPVVELSQKIILNAIDFNKLKRNPDPRVLGLLQKTKNNVFLPFRAILSKIDPKCKEIRPFASDLFRHINGPEWLNWLQIYLRKTRNQRDTFMVLDKQIPFIIKSLSTMKITFESPIFTPQESQVLKLIRNLRQENKKYFYEAVCAIMNDADSVEFIEEQFKLGGAEIFSELRQLTEQIMKYPHCSFDSEDLPELRSKALYFLANIKLIPERVFDFEDQFFESQGFVDTSEPRCDRVCHLILDLLSYFSLIEYFDEDIIIGVFQAIVIMMKRPDIKQWMSLALNINKPSLQFFNRTLSDKLVAAISSLTAFLLDSEEFFDSVRTSDQTIALLKAYPFRYQPNKSMEFIKDIQYTIPEYWFSNCLNALVKQNYNPELLDKMLCKLKWAPSTNQLTVKPSLLEAIVNACNRCSFWKDLTASLEVQINMSGNVAGVFNKILLADASRYFLVHQSLRLFSTMLQLKEIYEKSEKVYRLHTITSLLANLRCLTDMQRFINPIVNQKTLKQSKSNSVLLLISLVGENSHVINQSAYIGSEWKFPEINLIDNELLFNQYRLVAKNIDYSILKDPLMWPKNKYLENLACIASYAFKALTYIIRNSPETAIQAALYIASQVGNPDEGGQRMKDFKQQLKQRFFTSLSSPQNTVSEGAWQLLSTMRKHPKNKNLAREIYKYFCQKNRKSITNIFALKQIGEFLCQEAEEEYFQSDKIVTDLIEGLKSVKVQNLNTLLTKYQNGHEGSQTVTQFNRIVLERKLMSVVDYYDQVRVMCEYILKCIYNRNIMADKYCSAMMAIINDKSLLGLFAHQFTPIEGLELDQTLPRCYGTDILECFLFNRTTSRSNVLGVQIKNVARWCNLKLQLLNKAVVSFLSVVLSIDQTFYSNHPIPLKDRKHSNFFCELHLTPTKYSAIQLVGQNQEICFETISNCLEVCIQKIENLKLYGMSSQILVCFSVIDLMLSWLYQQFKNKLKANVTELSQFCSKILSTCYQWLGGAVNDPIVNKLLITIVVCSEGRFSNDMEKMIKATIYKTISTIETPSRIKQEILPLLILVPPLKHERNLIEEVTRLWASEQVNEYFYNQSRVLLKLSESYPIEVAKSKLFTQCFKLKTLNQFHLQRDRYINGSRRSQILCWIWALKIAAALMENGGESPIVVYEVSRFIREHKKRIMFVLNEPRLVVDESNRFHKDPIIQISMAQLQELEAVLELIASASMCNMWAAMESETFEEFLYALQHRTILLFVQNSMNSELQKRYSPQSDNEKALWEMFPTEFYGKRTMSFAGEPDMDEEDLYETKVINPSTFILSMTLKFQSCLKSWAFACSTGLKKSSFVREYFAKPIGSDTVGGVYKYTLTHWDHLNKAICQLIEYKGRHVAEWMRWEKKEGMLSLLNDVFNSGEMFAESGYLSTTQNYPQNIKQLFEEISDSVGLLLEVGSCHLICQIYFKKLKGTISRDSLKNFREKLAKLSDLAKDKLRRAKVNDESLQAIEVGKEYLEVAQQAF